MLESPAELSSDLEWIILSGQLDQPTLAAALVETCYAELHRCAAAITNDSRIARQVTLHTISQMINQRHRSTNRGIRPWMFTILVKACHQHKASPISTLHPTVEGTDVNSRILAVIEKLNLSERITLILCIGHGFTGQQAAEIIAAKSKHATDRLPAVLQKIEQVCRTELGKLPEDELHGLIKKVLEFRWPDPVINESVQSSLVLEVLRLTNRSGWLQHIEIRTKEVGLIAGVILLIVTLLRGAYALYPEQVPTEPVTPQESTPVSVVQAVTPAPNIPMPTATPQRPFYPPYPTDKFYTVEEGDTLISIGRDLGLAPDIVRRINRLAPGTILFPGQELFIPYSIESSPAILPTPQVFITPPEAVSLDSTSEEISQGMMRGWEYIQSMWFDALVIYSGPSGYDGYEQVYRYQGWIGSPNALVLIGPPNGSPAQVTMMLNDQWFIAQPGQDNAWFTPSIDDRDLDVLFQLYLTIFFPSYPLPPGPVGWGPFKTLGVGEIAGQEVVIVQREDTTHGRSQRIWVDRRYGFPLKQQLFEGNQREGMILETRLMAIDYDAPLPAHLMDPWLPWRGGYAYDFTGQPIPRLTPPLTWQTRDVPPKPSEQSVSADYDLSASRLSFSYMVDPNFFNSAEAYQILQEYPGADDERLNWQPLLLDLEEPTTRYLVKLYADDYYLATIDLANPFELQCERSEDGLWLAISEFSLSDWGSAYQNLRWLNLTQPTNIQSASQSLTTRGYAFSPDGAYLAVSGILRGQQGVYLIDTANGDLQQINDDEIVQSLVWKPDGTQLAYIFGYDDGNYPYKMRVVDIISGEETTYELEFQGGGYGTIIPDPSWPLLDWGVSFPSNPGDLGTCAKPPQQTAEE